MPAPRLKLEELLLRHGAIDQEQLQRAREEQKTLGGDLGRVLVDLGYITDELLCRAQSHQLGIPRASPETLSIAPELLQLISVQACESLGAIPVGRDPANKSLSDLWVTCQQAMGVPAATFGDPTVCGGPLAELRTP